MPHFVIRIAFLGAAAVSAACMNEAPPPGALVAQAAFPVFGTSWVLHVTNSATDKPADQRVGTQAVEQQGFGDRTVKAVPIRYHGAQAYGLQVGNTVTVYNPQSFNQMAIITNGKETETISPDSGDFSWPLWVGKSWNASGTFEGRLPTTNWSLHREVTAYEDVTVPAGTFKAFRIESSPGQNMDIGSHSTTWYAPSVAYVVKIVASRTGRALSGPGTTTIELVSRPNSAHTYGSDSDAYAVCGPKSVGQPPEVYRACVTDFYNRKW